MAEYTEEQNRFLNALHNSTSDDYEHFSPLVEPFIQDGWCTGTDGHHLLRIKQALIPENEVWFRKTEHPDVKSVIPTEFNTKKVITYDAIRAALDKVPMTNEVKCEDCHGDGTVTWVYNSVDGISYDMRGECPVCGGCGEVKLEDSVKDENYPIKIKDIFISSRQLIWFAKSMLTLQLKNICLCSVTDRAYFRRDLDIDMLIMSCKPESEKELSKNPPIILV